MPGLDLSLSVQHGNELGFGFTSFFDSKAEPPRESPTTLYLATTFLHQNCPPDNKKAGTIDYL